MHHVELEASALAPVSAALKLGSRAVYTIYTGGWSRRGQALVPGGFGVRARASGWHIDTDLVASRSDRLGTVRDTRAATPAHREDLW